MVGSTGTRPQLTPPLPPLARRPVENLDSDTQSAANHWSPWRVLYGEALPSWLMSTLFHLGLMLMLALLTVSRPSTSVEHVLHWSPEDDAQRVDAAELQITDPLNVADTTALTFQSAASSPAPVPELHPEPPETAEPSLSVSRVRHNSVREQVAESMDLMMPVEGLRGEALGGRGENQRGAMLAKYGGTPGSERAVALALRWFAAHQLDNGGWSLDHRHGECAGRCTQPGVFDQCYTGAAALALLPFLGAGQTHEEGQYQEEVRRGLDFLLRYQDKRTGSLVSGAGNLYSHGLATITLCEAYAMTRDARLKAPAQAAVDYLCRVQDTRGGGWRYFPRQSGDTSAVAWQLMALKSAHMGYLEVPKRTVARVDHFLDSMQLAGGSQYGYNSALTPRPSTSAAGLLCRMYLGWTRQTPALQQGIAWLSDRGPAPSEEHTKYHMYYNYYGTQVMRHYGGDTWVAWNEVMREQLVASQESTEHQAGSWTIPGIRPAHDTEMGGRLYYTSLATMILEVYYRHMPIYSDRVERDSFPL